MTDHHDADEEPGPSAPDDPVEHLWRAAHELLLAARALIDAADAVVEQQLRGATGSRDAHARPEPRPGSAREPREPRVRRIDVG